MFKSGDRMLFKKKKAFPVSNTENTCHVFILLSSNSPTVSALTFHPVQQLALTQTTPLPSSWLHHTTQTSKAKEVYTGGEYAIWRIWCPPQHWYLHHDSTRAGMNLQPTPKREWLESRARVQSQWIFTVTTGEQYEITGLYSGNMCL